MGRTEDQLIAKRDELTLRDTEQLAAIRGYGVDLDKKRVIDLTFWAPDKTAAELLAEGCKRNEMPPNLVLEPTPSEANQRWLVRCSIQASPNFVSARENLVTFLLFADKYECEYDGWGTAIVEAASASHRPQ